MVKGPYWCGWNFLVRCDIMRFVPSSQNLSLFWYGANCVFCRSVSRCCAWAAALWASHLRHWTWVLHSDKVGNPWDQCAWCACGMYPMIYSKGALPVVSLVHALCVYCMIGNHSLQLFYVPFAYIWRNCLTHWLLCSNCLSVCRW